MTDRPQNDARLAADPTRDITLPPLPDRPPSAMPRQWAELRPTAPAEGAAATPDFSSPPPALPVPDEPEAALPPHDEQDAAPPAHVEPDGGHAAQDSLLADQPTDQLKPPARPRERTLAFSSPEMTQRPVAPVQVGRTSRRWPWVVLTLLPILIIAGAAVAWLVLIRSM
jgi:hypothetical protein